MDIFSQPGYHLNPVMTFEGSFALKYINNMKKSKKINRALGLSQDNIFRKLFRIVTFGFELIFIEIPKKIGCACGINLMCEEKEERYTELQYKYEQRENFFIAGMVANELGLLDGIKFEFSAKNIIVIDLTIYLAIIISLYLAYLNIFKLNYFQ